jgi:hypothetical protein
MESGDPSPADIVEVPPYIVDSVPPLILTTVNEDF